MKSLTYFGGITHCGIILVAQMVKNLPAMQEIQVRSLGLEDPLEKGMSTHSSILAWRTPWTEEPGWDGGGGGYSPWGHRVNLHQKTKNFKNELAMLQIKNAKRKLHYTHNVERNHDFQGDLIIDPSDKSSSSH